MLFDYGSMGHAGYGLDFNITGGYFYTPSSHGGKAPGVSYNLSGSEVSLVTAFAHFNNYQDYYLNGEFLDSTPITLSSLSATQIDTSNIFRIGTQAKADNRAGRFFKGKIAELLIFDTKLSSDEIINVNCTYQKSGGYQIMDSDGDGQMDDSDLTVGAISLNNPPVFTSTPMNASENSELVYSVSATDADGDDISFDLIGPYEASLVDNGDGTAVLRWTPTKPILGCKECLFEQVMELE